MRIPLRPLVLLAFAIALTTLSGVAQTLIGTVAVGYSPNGVAVNPATNKSYSVNTCGNDSSCSSGTVTEIDGATLTPTTISVGSVPIAIAVNSVTNKIYAANYGNAAGNSVTVIDGTTRATRPVNVGIAPYALAVNAVTNKVYVANFVSNTVTVIDGVSLGTATVQVGIRPVSVAVDEVRNQIYVVNQCVDQTCVNGTVTVIDGTTLGTSTVAVGPIPGSAAVNSVTNKIYVSNGGGNTVTVIDGATRQTRIVTVGNGPSGLAINAVTNKIYVPNFSDGTVSVIDGGTFVVTPVTAGPGPNAAAANPVTNTIYVTNLGTYPNYGTTVTVINGATFTTTPLTVGHGPDAVAVNAVTDRIFVTNSCGDDATCHSNGTVSVIGGVSPTALQFVLVAPCRLVDTRNPNGAFGGPPITGGTSRNFPIPQQTPCDIPAAAAAYSLNVTLVPVGAPVGFLSIWPTGESQPNVSTMNSFDGRYKANAAIVSAGYQGGVSVYASNTTNVLLDIDGYFEPVSGSTLAFYSLAPCRVADTRGPIGNLGGPYLHAGVTRRLPVLESACGIPDTAQAYSFNFTAIPRGGPVYVFTAWPDGPAQPGTSTLNAPTGTVVANAGIVPAGTHGDIDVWASNDSDLLIDVDGYFAPAGAGGLSLYSMAPCRALDTRSRGTGAPFNGMLSPPADVIDSVCQPPAAVQAYVFNATIVPATGPVYFLTLWPNGEGQPNASTLNSYDAAVTSNMAIVPTTNGSIDADAAGLTQLILDISSYFAP